MKAGDGDGEEDGEADEDGSTSPGSELGERISSSCSSLLPVASGRSGVLASKDGCPFRSSPFSLLSRPADAAGAAEAADGLSALGLGFARSFGFPSAFASFAFPSAFVSFAFPSTFASFAFPSAFVSLAFASAFGFPAAFALAFVVSAFVALAAFDRAFALSGAIPIDELSVSGDVDAGGEAGSEAGGSPAGDGSMALTPGVDVGGEGASSAGRPTRAFITSADWLEGCCAACSEMWLVVDSKGCFDSCGLSVQHASCARP